jgi:hypothetical protein
MKTYNHSAKLRNLVSYRARPIAKDIAELVRNSFDLSIFRPRGLLWINGIVFEFCVRPIVVNWSYTFFSENTYSSDNLQDSFYNFLIEKLTLIPVAFESIFLILEKFHKKLSITFDQFLT